VGTTPLLRAAKAGDAAAIRLLLQYKANVELPNINGITPLLAAAGIGSSALDTRGRYKTETDAQDSVKLLLAAGANLAIRDRSGQTPLHGAASWGWNSVVTTLVEHKIDLHAKDARGRTAVDLTRGEASTSGRAAGSQARPETEELLRRLMAANPAGSAAP
jgi:uncharacterized protein